MKHFVGLFSILLLFSGCGQNSTELYSKAMTDSARREFLRYTIIKDTTKASEWTPSEDQIVTIEALLKDAIRANQSIDNKRLKPDSLLKYFRQYSFYVSNGDSIVSINAFCRVPDNYKLEENGKLKVTRFDWQHRYLQVEDGGDCYWYSIINFTKKTTQLFSVNGRA